ncbi:MAG: hypothetical protein IPP78_15995 [Holophagaceae bacterium]|nr:hypothetical protein [Holophagaceae bacterium]
MATPLRPQRIQAPDAPWKTIQTTHYRIHYPQRGDFESFAMEVASKIEGIHAKVTEWVGYESPRMVDVLIRDPRLEGNGMAYPFLKHPFVELWKTPPESDSAIAHFTTWPELLVTHELTHIHHLMRPQKNPRLLDKVLDLPIGPLTLKAPRWVIEGYATVIEGRVTGSGRPHSAYRAALLRQWAREGKLPDYGSLNGFNGFRGGGMAYMVGSAYLEWLERKDMARPGNKGEKDALKKLWRKLASGRGRSFDAIFMGTFGFSAQDGYDRFRAELSADALAFEQRMQAQHLVREGGIFTKVDGEVTDLSVSSDGTRLMARVVTPGFKGLRVWDFKAPDKSERPKTADMDTPPSRPIEKATWELGRLDGLIPEKPFWAEIQGAAGISSRPIGPGLPPTHEIVGFSLREPNDEGVLQRRMKSWRPGYATASNGSNGSMARVVAPEKRPLFQVVVSDGLLSIWTTPSAADSSSIPVVRTASAAWLPAPTPDRKTLYYVQLGATGCEIRKLDLALPPLTQRPVPWGDSFFATGGVKPNTDEASQLPPPAKPSPAHDYAADETMWLGLRSGLTLAPSGKSTELGWGGTDLLGRFSWQVLGAVGNVAGPRGAQAALVYRGWRWAPAFHTFSLLERPSRQQIEPAPGFDRQRTGGELAFTYVSRNTTPAFFKPALAFERVEPNGGSVSSTSRGLVAMELGISHLWNRGESWGIRLSAQAKDGLGRTEGRNWQFQRGHVKVGLFTPWIQAALKAESARVLGDPTSLDRLHLGGLRTSLIPASLDWNRVEQPALPSYNALGDRMRRLRVEIGSGLRAYIEHTVVWDHTQDHPAFTKVAGVEFDLMQVIGNSETIERLVGHMTFVVGIHRVLNETHYGSPMQGRTVSTVSLVVQP